MAPSSIAGDNLLWKKAQKKDTKNNTSDKINKIIPQTYLHYNLFSPLASDLGD